MRFLIGVDVGGTFTDSVAVDETGNLHVFKVPSTPANPEIGFMRCIEKAASSLGTSSRALLQDLGKLAYGTTIATNTLIQGKAAKTGLITTKGFRDTLPIARISREYLSIDLQVEKPPSLTPRSLIEEVSERVDRSGRVITPLDMEDVESAIHRLVEKGVEAIAVCLLWAFKNPLHEIKIREVIAGRHPHIYVSLSSEIAPLIGEYERTATTTMNASLGPPIKVQLGELGNQLRAEGLGVPLLLMQSIGGVIPAEEASFKPVTLVNSGPAGGVIASKYFSELLGLPNLVCIDMGGTSLDVSLITEGQYGTSLVSRFHNHNVFVPMVDVHSIGAGGGSTAWLDMGIRLKVGPQSAGAQPGPACYSRGGVEPTVTDADVVLGRINPQYLLGGEMLLDQALARRTISEKIAEPLGISVDQAASGICQIVDADMADAIRLVTVQKGYDVRDYALIAFGGAGPTHAASLARELGIRTVVMPFLATAQSAFGIVASDIFHSLSISDLMELDDPERISQCYEGLEREGRGLLQKEHISDGSVEIVRYADMRYKGQAHEVSMGIPSKNLDSKDLAELADRFEEKYISLYGPGTAFREAGFELVNLRVNAIGRTVKPSYIPQESESEDASPALKMRREVFFETEGAFIVTRVYNGDRLRAGNMIEGPAIVEYVGTTAVIYPQQIVKVDRYLNLVLEWEDRNG
ncbi:hydantoinase/oxoprolinase family protein [Chloroflexota bacterium]